MGHDLVDIGRVAGLLESGLAARFLERVLTSGERELAAGCAEKRRAEFVAGRFAAKEAVVKALGCGIGAKVSFADIHIGKDPMGKPEALLTEAAWKRLGLDGSRIRLFVTITHERGLASAFAVAEDRPDSGMRLIR
ncbi:holo-ACP synthase [Paenibacillus cisolokensis]|uniref:holo-ACP synthase n=1 Tax=Paenibacillus cisolokensis TaxID=1658519 RepID=UPI003D272478